MISLCAFDVRRASAGIVFEYYPTERPAEADIAVPRVLDELEKTGQFVARTASVRAELGRLAPTPGLRDRNLTAQELLAEINIGLKAQYDLRNDQAIVQFAAAIEKGHANPALLVTAPKYRDAMLDALVGLATTYHRRNRGDDRLRGIEIMQEVIRSFPDRLVTLRQTYGPEPDALYKAALKLLQARGTGSLVVDVDDPNALIFVNEGDPQNATFRAKLPPGKYRVLVKLPTNNGRRFDVEVHADETAKLSVDWAIASSLTATTRWIGFAGVTGKAAVAFASQIAGQRHTTLVVITMEAYKGAPAVKASLYRTSDNQIVRAFLITLDVQVEAKATALARVIANGADTSPLVVNVGPFAKDADEPTPRSNPSTEPARRPTNWWFVGAGIAGAVALAGGGSALKFALDGRAAGDQLDRVCAVSCASDVAGALIDKQDRANRLAIVSGLIGGAALIGGVVLILIGGSGQDQDRALAILPQSNGLAAAYTWRF